MHRALCVFTLPCFFLWIRFLLCGAFLLSRLILFRFSFLFRHKIKLKVSELFTHGCSVFLPVLRCCPFRSGNHTARLLVNKDMPIRVNTIFDQGEPPGQIVNLFSATSSESQVASGQSHPISLQRPQLAQVFLNWCRYAARQMCVGLSANSTLVKHKAPNCFRIFGNEQKILD